MDCKLLNLYQISVINTFLIINIADFFDMNTPRALDHDGLDGVLPPPPPPFKKRKFWIGLAVLLVILLILFWLSTTKPGSDTTSLSKTELLLSTEGNIEPMESESIKLVSSSVQNDSSLVSASSQSNDQIESMSDINVSIDSNNSFLKETKKSELPISGQLSDPQPGFDKVVTITAENKYNSNNENVANSTQIYLFKVSSRELPSFSKDEAKRLTDLIDRCDTKIIVVGHTCSLGTAEFNDGLGLARATSMYQYLIRQGVNPDVITVRSEGMGKPVASNATRVGRRLNRRIELSCKNN
jgi:outer membrane protein OmpA-like peptidoglycan-associated protein